MKNILLGCHFLFAGIWLGCVLTEALFERALLAGDRQSHLKLSALHVRVDQFIELPAIAVVLLTGALLLMQSAVLGTPQLVMITAGLVAIAANLYCVSLVFNRQHAAQASDWTQFDQLDHLQHKVGAVVLIGLLVAIGAGMWGRGGV